jgi:hypothetical protein
MSDSIHFNIHLTSIHAVVFALGSLSLVSYSRQMLRKIETKGPVPKMRITWRASILMQRKAAQTIKIIKTLGIVLSLCEVISCSKND